MSRVFVINWSEYRLRICSEFWVMHCNTNHVTDGNFHSFSNTTNSPLYTAMPVVKAVQGVCEIVYHSHDSPMDTSARVPYFTYQLVKKENWHWSRIQNISFQTKNTNRSIYTVRMNAKLYNKISQSNDMHL